MVAKSCFVPVCDPSFQFPDQETQHDFTLIPSCFNFFCGFSALGKLGLIAHLEVLFLLSDCVKCRQTAERRNGVKGTTGW